MGIDVCLTNDRVTSAILMDKVCASQTRDSRFERLTGYHDSS